MEPSGNLVQHTDSSSLNRPISHGFSLVMQPLRINVAFRHPSSVTLASGTHVPAPVPLPAMRAVQVGFRPAGQPEVLTGSGAGATLASRC